MLYMHDATAHLFNKHVANLPSPSDQQYLPSISGYLRAFTGICGCLREFAGICGCLRVFVGFKKERDDR